MDYTHHYASPLGGVTLACDGDALVGLWFDGQKRFGEALYKEREEKALPVLLDAVRWLDVYFSGKAPDFTPKLRFRGTAFQRAVWHALLSIPYGQTMTYGEITTQLARQRQLPRLSPRAVGAAVGRNPISLIVPCHRVVGAGGSLTGYAGGLDRKRSLLLMEGATPGGRSPLSVSR